MSTRKNFINPAYQYDWANDFDSNWEFVDQERGGPIKDVIDKSTNRKIGAYNMETGTKYGLTDPGKIQNPNNLSALGQSIVNNQIQNSLDNNNSIVNSGDNQATESAKQTALGTGDIQNNGLVNPATVQQTPKPDGWRPLSDEDVAKMNQQTLFSIPWTGIDVKVVDSLSQSAKKPNTNNNVIDSIDQNRYLTRVNPGISPAQVNAINYMIENPQVSSSIDDIKNIPGGIKAKIAEMTGRYTPEPFKPLNPIYLTQSDIDKMNPPNQK